MATMAAALTAAFFLYSGAQAQSVLQTGPVTPNHAPMYAPGAGSAAALMDSGPASGGNYGSGLGELNITSKGAAGGGTGPLGTHFCMDDAATSAAGWHYLCFDPNIGNNLGAIDFGSVGNVTPGSLEIVVNGTAYPFPGSLAANVIAPTNPYPTTGDVALWNGTTTLRDGGLALPHVPTEAALAASCVAATACPAGDFLYPNGVWRDDYSAGLGAPPLFYADETGTCTTNSLTSDGGNCVNSADGNSFVARFPAAGADIREWGVTPSANSATAVQAAFNASPYYGTLTIPAEIIPVGSTIACTHPVKVVGAEGKPSNQPAFYDGFSGFKPTGANETLFDLQNGCSGSRFDSFYVQMDAAGQNSSGAAFQEDPSSNIDFSYVAVQGACIAFDANGNGQSFSHVMATQVTGSGCEAMRIGYQTTQGATVDTHVSDSVLQGCPVLNQDGSVATACANNSSAAQATAGMLVLDGNPIVHGNDILYFVNGTKIFPGANQYVNAFTGDNTVLGDTTSGAPLVIATNATTARVQQFKCSLCWVAAYKSAAGTPGVSINNSGGGTLNGVHFVGLTDYSVGGDGIDIVGTTTEPLDTTIDASVICGMGSQGGSYDGVNVGFGVNDVTIRNTKISGSCDGSNNGAMQYAVLFAGNNNTIVMTADNFYGWTSQAVSGEPSQCSGNTCSSIIANNLGIDDQTPAIASATTIDPGVYPNVEVSGTATVSTINGCWDGRHLTMRPSGAVVFATGGNLSNGLTASPPVPVLATGFGTNPCMWALK